MTLAKHFCLFLVIVTTAPLTVEGQSGDVGSKEDIDPRFSGAHVSPCGDDTDWLPYKEEKCLKLFDQLDPVHQMTYSDSKIFCKKQHDANLVSIPDKEKQEFLEAYLKYRKVNGNVWIGLEYKVDKKDYEWADGTKYVYKNWAAGSPRNKSDYCVLMQHNISPFGTWSDDLCTVKNKVLCEKVQPWPISSLQKTIIDLEKKLDEFMNNVFPVGFIYVQLPKEKSPKEIWPWLSWKDVSYDYAGVFFRVYGGESGSWGSVQDEEAPVMTYVFRRFYKKSERFPETVKTPKGRSEILKAGFIFGFSSRREFGLSFYRPDIEVRPKNMAIRIWRRSQ